MKKFVKFGINSIINLNGNVLSAIKYMMASDVCEMGHGVKLMGGGSVINQHGPKDSIKIGDNCIILGEIQTLCAQASISMDSEVYIGQGSRINCSQSIRIGSRVQIAHNVNIFDNNSHSVSAKNRYEHMKEILSNGHPKVMFDVSSAPIIIEDDVWIGFGASILKGVRIGKGAIIASSTVVTKDVQPFTIVVGNPQREVGCSKE